MVSNLLFFWVSVFTNDKFNKNLRGKKKWFVKTKIFSQTSMAGIWLHFAIIHFHDQIELVTRCKKGDALDIAFTLAYRSISSHFTCAIAFFIYLNRIYYNFFLLAAYFFLSHHFSWNWWLWRYEMREKLLFLLAAFWNEGKKISVTIGEKKTEQSDVMNESKNEPEILWCLCKKKKEKKRKEKKREKQQHRGWQSMQWRVANWQKSLLLPFAKQPKCFTPAQQFSTDFFSFLRLPDEIRFF